MQEIGIESSVLTDMVKGHKTIEGRLGKGKFLKMRVGDIVSLREDVWQNGAIVHSTPNKVRIRIAQILYFESFKEMLESLNFKQIIPSAENIDDALAVYRQFYSPADEREYGVIAFVFDVER